MGYEAEDPELAKAPKKDFVVGGLTFDYYWDIYSETIESMMYAERNLFEKYDTIIIDVGHWLMHEQYADYFKRIDKLLASIEAFKERVKHDVKFVWFGTPAWPHREDRDVQEYTRTNSRLAQMDAYSSRRFKEEGHVIMDTFTLSLPFVRNNESPDLEHWFHRPVMTVMHRMIAHLADLCLD